MRPCDIMAAKPCPNLARTHALHMQFPLCFRCVLPCASLTFPVFRTQFRYEQASNSIGFAYAQLRETDAKPPLAPIAQLLHARRRSFARSNDLFAFFLSRVHSCTIRLISLFPMTKNARYGKINFRGRLAQRERRCLTSIGSGVQIPHRPPFERTMAAHLSSHFLFPIIQTAISIQLQRIRSHRHAPQFTLQIAPRRAQALLFFFRFSLSLPQAHTKGGKPCQMSN